MRSFLLLLFSLSLFSFSSFNQGGQTATFKNLKDLFAKEGKAYTVKFQLSVFPGDELQNEVKDYAAANRSSIRFTPAKSGGAQVLIQLPEDLAQGPVLGKFLVVLQVVDVVILSEGSRSISIEEFIQKL